MEVVVEELKTILVERAREKNEEVVKIVEKIKKAGLKHWEKMSKK